MWKDSKIASKIITGKVSNLLSFTPYNTQMGYQKIKKPLFFSFFFFFFREKRNSPKEEFKAQTRLAHCFPFLYLADRKMFYEKILHAVR